MAELDDLRDALGARLDAAGGQDVQALLAEAGVLGLPFAEAHGGLGLDVRAGFAVLEVLGPRAIASGYLESVLLAGALVDRAGGESTLLVLPELSVGAATLAFACTDDPRAPLRATQGAEGWVLDGRKIVVIDGADSDHVVALASVGGEAAAFLVPQGVAEVQRYPTIDGRVAADLNFHHVALPWSARLSVAAEDIARTLDVGVAGVAAEAAAIMARLVADTRDYLVERRQFGQPIASFQAVQHRLVDMLIESRRAAAAARLAAAALDLPAPERGTRISAAKVTIADAARFVGQNAVQLHGGMGMTEELPVSALFKRLTVIEGEFGSRDAHLLRFMAPA